MGVGRWTIRFAAQFSREFKRHDARNGSTNINTAPSRRRPDARVPRRRRGLAESQSVQTQPEQDSGHVAWVCTAVGQGAVSRNSGAVFTGSRRLYQKEFRGRYRQSAIDVSTGFSCVSQRLLPAAAAATANEMYDEGRHQDAIARIHIKSIGLL